MNIIDLLFNKISISHDISWPDASGDRCVDCGKTRGEHCRFKEKEKENGKD